jgi:uncharacterized surface protein with fasciclin (FAS1) repeats
MVIDETTNGATRGLGPSSWETARTELRPKGRNSDFVAPCLLDVLRSLGDFETFLRLAEAAQVTEDLAGRSPLTVLAPTDAGFAAHDIEMLLAPEATEALCDYVERHLARGAVALDQALEAGVLDAIDGTRFNVREKGGRVWFEHARLERAPLAARNGFIFPLDRPLSAPMLLPVPIRSRSAVTISAPSALRAGGAADALDGARALMSLAPSQLQTTSSAQPFGAPPSHGCHVDAGNGALADSMAPAKPEGPRENTSPHEAALDQGRTALLALASSMLRRVVEPEAVVETGRSRDGVRSG